MLSCCLHHILTLTFVCCTGNRDSSDQAAFFQSFVVQFQWAWANCSLSFLFSANRSDNQCGPSHSRFDALCIQRCSYAKLPSDIAYLDCNRWLSELLFLSWKLSGHSLLNSSAHGCAGKSVCVSVSLSLSKFMQKLPSWNLWKGEARAKEDPT